MRITTRITFDMSTWAVLEHQYFDYSGTVDLCKGDSTVKQSELQSMKFQSQLMEVFQKQYGEQSAVLNFLKERLQPMIDKPTGYGDAAKAAMRASATDTISQQYDNAQKALQNQEFSLGGRDLPSGVSAMRAGALKSAQAGDTASALNTIELNDENLKQNNYWNATNVLSGNVASQYNPLGYASQSTNAAGAVANSSQAYKASQSSQLLGALGGVAGGVGTALSGRFGKG